jgi:hypothetical protein
MVPFVARGFVQYIIYFLKDLYTIYCTLSLYIWKEHYQFFCSLMLTITEWMQQKTQSYQIPWNPPVLSLLSTSMTLCWCHFVHFYWLPISKIIWHDCQMKSMQIVHVFYYLKGSRVWYMYLRMVHIRIQLWFCWVLKRHVGYQRHYIPLDPK